jgi:hypothetical protein
MGAAQIILIALSTAGLFLSMQSHGDYVKENFFHNLIGVAIGYGLLIWGGFFG